MLIQVEERSGEFRGGKENHRLHLEDLGQRLSDLELPERVSD